MKWTRFVVALALVATASLAAADDVELESSLEQRFARIESELAELQQDGYGANDSAECVKAPVCCQCPPTGLYGGAEIVFAKPYFKESFEVSTVDLTGTQTLQPTNFDYTGTPRVWLGYVGANRLGVRTRYWELDASEGPDTYVSDGFRFPGAQHVTIIFPAAISTDFPGESLQVSSGIEMQTFELEGTWHFEHWGAKFIASAGLGYARIGQSYNSAVIVGGVAEQVLNWDRQLEGVGPTAGIEVRKPVVGGFQFFGGTHFSMLFAEKDIHRFSIGLPAAGPFQTIPSTNFDNADELLATAQLQLGLQWAREISLGGELFARASYEGQLWTDSGGNALGYLGVQGFGLAVGVTR